VAGYTGRALAMAGGIIGIAALAAYFGIAHVGEPERGGGSIAGQVQIAPNLADQVKPTDVLFVIVRRPTGAPRPIAAKRIDGPKFPVQFEITNADVMVQGSELKGMVDVIARLDRDGQAGQPQPGDMEGRYAKNPTLPGGRDLMITIDKVY
jgi:cytochrome c-type biogenesis protein CcmH